MALSQKVRDQRQALGLSQERLAQAAGLTWGSIQRLESGQVRDPHYSTLESVAGALGMRVSELMEESALAVGKGEGPESGRSEPERPVQDPVHDSYGWVRDETTEDLKRMALEEAQYAKAPVREEWVEERNADRKAWLEKGRRRTLAYTTIVAINAELERRGVRSPVELAIKQYNEVMGSADSVPEASADEASEAG